MATSFPLPADWSLVLDRIQRALAQVSELAQEREIAHTASLSDVALVPSRQETLNQFPRRLSELDERINIAAQNISHVDQALAEAEARFRAHLATADSLRGRLEKWLGRAIG